MNNEFVDILNNITEGVVILDKNKGIKYTNGRFETMMGMVSSKGPGHKAGRAVPGDIAILVCNAVDVEEDTVYIKDLEAMGVNTNDIKVGDAILAVGEIGAMLGSAKMKTVNDINEEKMTSFKVELDNGPEVIMQVNAGENLLGIYVAGESIEMNYQTNNALTVILDKDTYEIKFYQDRGYTLRNENFADVVRGFPYIEKHTSIKPEEILGTPLAGLAPAEKCIELVDSVLSGQKSKVEHYQLSMNALHYLVSLYPVKNETGEIYECSMMFKDITYVKTLQDKIRIDKAQNKAFESVVGNSKGINENVKQAKKIARSKSTVLITGESGTGKGIYARAIHKASKRADKNFVSVNMAAIPSELLESELFGYKKGAFTGANTTGKKGLFQAANGGTIFLDEIGEISMHLQAKLLQVLQEDYVVPVGSEEVIPIDVRVIAATNRNLEEEVENGNFRADLYYRLNVVNIEMIPLRERKEDILPLVEHFVPIMNEKAELSIKGVDQDVINQLLLYDWPGNVRELENTLEYAANMTEEEIIGIDDLPSRIMNAKKRVKVKDVEEVKLKDASSKSEKEAIIRALEMTNNNKYQAAKLLGIGRTTFYSKLKKYNL